MTFVGLQFCFFCGMTILFYFLFPKKNRWLVLLFSSIIFYCTWSLKIIYYIVFSIICAYCCSIAIYNKNKKAEIYLKEIDLSSEEKKNYMHKNKNECKLILAVGLLFILSALIFTKGYRLYHKSFIAPVGISYYTLSLVAYMADVYWKKIKEPEHNILKLALFAMYFPKILQGPICKFQNISKQLFDNHEFEYENLCFGIQLMLWGYFKKIVIADRLMMFVNSVFDNIDRTSGCMVVVAAILGSFQLYCDFSGCMNIAEGFSQILGISLEKNFNHPFFSETAAEFWRRWHITLGVWFKDYIYMPLVVSPTLIKLSGKIRSRFGKRSGKAFITIVPLSCVWLLTGLWHGTGWNYVIWGCFWGSIIIISTIFDPEIQKVNLLLHIPVNSSIWHFFRKIRTFLLFSFTRIITIPNNFLTSKEALKLIIHKFNIWELFDGSIFLVTDTMNRANFMLVFLCIFLLGFVSIIEEKRGSLRKVISEQPIIFRWSLYYGLLFSIIIFGIYGPGYDAAGFVYMQY